MGNVPVCADGSVLNGTDVSDNDGARTWPTVASANQSFVFVKATEGTTFTNPDFSTDWPAVAASGMVRGAYHYFHPADDPVAQADYFTSVVGSFPDTDLPPVLDWEETDGTSAAEDVGNALTWLDRVAQASGKTPTIYISAAFANSLGNPAELADYPLFVANYDVTCPSVPAPWDSWVFWQQSDSGTIPGIIGPVDIDLFNGTASDLAFFASTGLY